MNGNPDEVRTDLRARLFGRRIHHPKAAPSDQRDQAWSSVKTIGFPCRGAMNIGSGLRPRSIAWLAGLMSFFATSSASAHIGQPQSEDAVWNTWTLTPDIIIGTALIGLVYARGVARRRSIDDRARRWRHAAFAAGLAAVFLALASPIDYMAEHLFAVHQIQHLLLRMIGPMLIALSAPLATLIGGLPSGLRHNALVPILSNRGVQRAFSFLTNRTVTTILYVAALYTWQYPRYHNAALLNTSMHYLMHATMLAAGLLFWWRVFDLRPAPTGLTYGTRLMMLWIVILSNIGLGAYTTLKSEVLYSAYDVTGRLFGIRPLTDELVGGFVIWIPSSMMCLIAVILVIHMWGRHETRVEEKRTIWSSANSTVLHRPATGAELIEQARPKNRALAIGFLVFVITVFATAIFVGVLNHLNGTARYGLFGRAISNETSP